MGSKQHQVQDQTCQVVIRREIEWLKGKDMDRGRKGMIHGSFEMCYFLKSGGTEEISKGNIFVILSHFS